MMIQTLSTLALAAPLLLSPTDTISELSAKNMHMKRIVQQLSNQGITESIAQKLAVKFAGVGSQTLYVVRAGDARLNRRETGPATVSVQGVQAEPVHSGAFDGVGHQPVNGARFLMVVDPVNDTGAVFSSWNDVNGSWTYFRTVMAPPAHPTGLVIGPDATTIVPITDGVQTHGYQHGNTVVAGGPLMPTVFQHLSCYGPTEITLNGVPFVNTFSGPTAPEWFGAVKVSDGVRDQDDGTIRNTSGGIFSPMVPHDGATDPNDMEVQLIFHDNPLPQGSSVSNFPPRHRFFYWLNFEAVTMRVIHT